MLRFWKCRLVTDQVGFCLQVKFMLGFRLVGLLAVLELLLVQWLAQCWLLFGILPRVTARKLLSYVSMFGCLFPGCWVCGFPWDVPLGLFVACTLVVGISLVCLSYAQDVGLVVFSWFAC